MFGYIRADKEELKIKEFETYKAVYCSLCRKLGKNYGFLSRLTLSYDFTFLALLQLSLNDENVCIERKRCAFNPLKKCNYCKNDEALDMPSAAAMILLYYKLKDNIADERGLKKLGYILIKPIFKGAYKKAKKNFPYIDELVGEYISAQEKIEKESCRELDRAADPSALMLSRLLSLCSQESSQKRVLERIGYCLGRYIYILDAACDINEDKKKNSYNVLLYSKDDDYIEKRVKSQLYFCINEACKAFELLELKRFKTLLANILYLGLEETFKKELNK